MRHLSLGDELPRRSQTAFNYATESENRMHSDDGARRYGFRGGLVPGIADYAFFVPSVLDALGKEWAATGWMTAKLLRPVYESDRVEVRGVVSLAEPLEIVLELVGPSGDICATARAGSEGDVGLVERDPGRAELPSSEDRPPAGMQSLPVGKVLGSLSVSLDEDGFKRQWRENFGPSGEWPAGSPAPHPAFYPDLGNRILSSNVLLGPWIHTESRTRHLAAARWGEQISVRGGVRESFEKRGHEFVSLDVGFFGDDGRTLAVLDHRAIVRPRVVDSA